ncbi:MAG: heme ABC transporter permease [Acidiferrobacteraceae bacterium]|nr:heme ABC transporter permease [Acidiferrobacteraceae bacterium]
MAKTSIFHRLSSPSNFYHLAGKTVPWVGILSLLFFAYSLYGGLIAAPPDYQQGDSFRIIYVHVPSAWLSMLVYGLLATCAAISLIWRIKVADALARAIAPIGASYTFLALISGSIWGKPMWGTWWVWDARLTSELILLFLYLGYIALQSAFSDRHTGTRASAILAIVGVVNLPIIHYSVDWWNTLHQGATIMKPEAPSMHISMLIPLLTMVIAFHLHFITVALLRVRCELFEAEKRKRWVNNLA